MLQGRFYGFEGTGLMGRWVLLVGVLIGLATLVLQNLAIALPLVVFGQSVMVLPLGVWMGLAIAIGALGNGLLVMLGQASPQRRREPELRPVRPKTRSGSSRRQMVESLAEEIWEDEEDEPRREQRRAQPDDEWSVGVEDGEERRSPRRRRPIKEPPEDDALEDVIGGWEEPNRSQQGWNYEPEWDEEEAWVRPGTGRRPTRSRQRPPSVTPHPSLDNPQEPATRSPSEPRPQSPPAAPPPLKNFEKPGRPIQREQAGSVYSYRYRDDIDETDKIDEITDVETDVAGVPQAQQNPQSDPTSQPLITPPPKATPSERTPERSPSNPPAPIRKPRTPLNLPPESEAAKATSKPQRRSVMDAEYRVLRPPDPDYDDRRSPQGRDDWDESDNDFGRTGEDDWDDW